MDKNRKDQPTIRAGVNGANNGDTVLVAQGNYFENINFFRRDSVSIAEVSTLVVATGIGVSRWYARKTRRDFGMFRATASLNISSD